MHRLARLVSITLLAAFVASCGGGGGASKAPQISVSPSALTFSDQVIVEASSPQSITVSNTGNADLIVSGASLSGTDASVFSLSNGCAAGVAPGASCSIAVTFKPTTTGSKQASISIASNASGAGTVTMTGSGVLPPPPSITATTLSVDVLGVTESSVSGTLRATDRYNLPLTYSVTTAAKEGTATAAAGGVLTYKIPSHLSSDVATSDSFVVTVSNGYTNSTSTVNVTLRADPLVKNQWHIQNTGQDSFSSVKPISTNDMRVGAAWALGVSGKGVKVAVVDDGLEINHEDLKPNVDAAKSINFLTSGTDPTPSGKDGHGTSVAGIIASTAFNGKGGRGVAYGATLRGYNLLASGAYSLANLATGLGGSPTTADNDVFNASFGSRVDPSRPLLPTFDPALGEINANALTLRGGKGAPLVQSAGNEFQSFSGYPDASCAKAVEWGVSCGNAASDTRRASTLPIVVGALAANGKKSSYSTAGSSIWVSAPGGEYGYDSSRVTTPDPKAFEPAIVTTSRTGCDNALLSNPVNALDSKGANPQAPSCQYTALMNGTSAAAPNLSAVIALMLEANPNLTLRDIKFILAKTAIRVDPNQAKVAPAIYRGAAFTLEQGWVRNAAGYYFSNWYGFGGVDAGAAVSMAKSYKDFLPPQKTAVQYAYTPSSNVAIPGQTSFSIDYPVTSDMTINEGVLVYFDMLTPAVLCNQLELTSPSGTKSILLNGASGFTNVRVIDTRLASNAFYGEPVNGTWRLTIYNLCTAAAGSTFLYAGVSQKLLIVGR
jgi:subtilisin family serine protease